MRLSVKCAFPHLRKRRPTSRKTALWPRHLTQKRILTPAPRKDPRVRLSVRTSYRMRFSVQHGLQNAPFRRMRFSSPAQTPTRLTQKRTLAVGPHGKAHSVPEISRKSAFWPWALTEKRILSPKSHAKAHSNPGTSRKTALCPRRLTEKRILRACRHQRTRSVSP